MSLPIEMDVISSIQQIIIFAESGDTSIYLSYVGDIVVEQGDDHCHISNIVSVWFTITLHLVI